MRKEEWQKFEVDKTKLEYFKNMGDGYLLEWNSKSGFIFYALLNDISENERKQVVDSSNNFEIAFNEQLGVGFVCVKFGSMYWGDCTFEPRLYEEEMEFPELTDGQGLGLYIVLVDPSKDGLVCGLRAIGLGREFSNLIIDWCQNKTKESFVKENYLKAIKEVQEKYTSSQLSKTAQFRYSTQNNYGEGNKRNAMNREDGR